MWPPFSGRALWHQTIDLNYVKSKRQAPERVEVRTYSHCGGTRELDDDTASAVHVDARCPGSCLKAGREPGAPGTPRASARTGFGGIVAKHRHILPFTSRIVSKATGNLRPILNLTVILGSLPNTDRRESNPGPSHGNQTLLEIPPMKYLPFTLLLMAAAMLIACGAGHPRLTSIAVSPPSATASSSPQGEVGFTATGTFTDHTSRELHLADGLEWKSSSTVVATIDDTGEATCVSPGSVTITATAPADLQITVSNGVQNTSPKVSGTATLNCT